MSYLIFAVFFAAAIIGLLALALRPSTNPSKSVDSFQRAIEALGKESEGSGKPPQ